jgi:Ca2+-binding RTX toxin-like protein
VGVTASATDPDGDKVTYSLVDNAGGRFSIESSTGVVRVANSSLLNQKTASEHQITVVAKDPSGASSTSTFKISVTVPTTSGGGSNSAPGKPVDANKASNAVKGGAAVGTKVGVTAFATDADGDKVTYSLVDNADGRFSIDASTGVVTVANGSLLNKKIASEHKIAVAATDPSGASSTSTFEISVIKVWRHKFWGTKSDDKISFNKISVNSATSSDDGVDLIGKAGNDVLKSGPESDGLLGGSGGDVLKGYGGNDDVRGGAGDDALDGGKGDDLLGGGAGKNILKGGAGADSFLFDSTPGESSPDVIKDFKPGTDHILLDQTAFEGIGPVGAVSAALFDVGSEALGANTRILYDSENGLLLYDKDGTGGSKGVVFAKLDSGLDIGAGDFLIV